MIVRAKEALNRIGQFDDQLEQEIVSTENVRMCGGGRLLIKGEAVDVTDAVEDYFRKRLRLSREFEQRLTPDTANIVREELFVADLQCDRRTARLPKQLLLSYRDQQIVGVGETHLLQLNNKQFIEAISNVLGDRLDTSDCHYDSDPTAEKWAIKLIFKDTSFSPVVGDETRAGMAIRFSAAGQQPIQITNIFYREYCENEAIVPICSDKKSRARIRRSGRQLGEMEMVNKVEALLREGVKQVDEKFKSLKNLTTEKPKDSKKLLQAIAEQQRLSSKVSDALVAALGKDQLCQDEFPGTYYEVWNALTQIATHADDQLLTPTARNRLAVYAGVYAYQADCLCTTCNQIIKPKQK